MDLKCPLLQVPLIKRMGQNLLFPSALEREHRRMCAGKALGFATCEEEWASSLLYELPYLSA